MTAAAALHECAAYAPDLQLDEDDYRSLVLLVAVWIIDVREKRRAEERDN